MKSVTFTGTRSDVQSKATAWKQAHRRVRIVADCRPAIIVDVNHAAQAPADTPIWACSIYYEDTTAD